MSKKRGLFGLILELPFNPKVITDLDLYSTSEMFKSPFISFNNAVIVALAILISFISISILLKNDPAARMVFGDLLLSIEIAAVLILVYTVKFIIELNKSNRKVHDKI